MNVKIGTSLIARQNEDLLDLTGKFIAEGAIEDAGSIRYSGVESGRRIPADEAAAVLQQVEQFVAFDAYCIAFAECSNSVQGPIETPVNQHAKVSRAEVTSYARKLDGPARPRTDEVMTLANDHQTGLMTKDADDIDKSQIDETMAARDDGVSLVPRGHHPWRVLWARDVLTKRHGRPAPQIVVRPGGGSRVDHEARRLTGREHGALVARGHRFRELD